MAKIRRHSFPIWGSALALLRGLVVSAGSVGRRRFRRRPRPPTKPPGLGRLRSANLLKRFGRWPKRVAFPAPPSTARSPASPSIPRSSRARNLNPSSCVPSGTTSRAPYRLTAFNAAATKRARKPYGSRGREDLYGVDDAVILGVWGLETDFGGFAGSNNIIRSLASLAYIHFQGDYFRDELLSALVILEEGDIAPSLMRGSWAGAMGQTQFMPSSYLSYAVAFQRHDRRDIWTSEADAIGSTANYLAKHGWTKGLPWGFEVRLPAKFALTAANSSSPAPFSSFAARGVRKGRRVATAGIGRGTAADPRWPQWAGVSRHQQFRRRSRLTTIRQPMRSLLACLATPCRAAPVSSLNGRPTIAP